MERSPAKLLWLGVAALAVAASPGDARPTLDAKRGGRADEPAAGVPFVDLHTHVEAGDPAGAARAALLAMPRENATRLVFQPPPFTADDPARYDAEPLLPVVGGQADRLTVFGGGGTLNPMIHEAVRTGQAGPEVERRFRERAEQVLRMGVAGLGELAAEHFPGATPYESARPDHPLFLLLADIAAEHRVPIVLHMEAVAHAMVVPAGIGPLPGKTELAANIDGLERLLAHDPRARIVWAHAGWDRTGHRTPELCRRLLRSHPNLYMDVKLDPGSPGKNPLLLPGPRPTVHPEWLQLFRDFPDRFVMGSDQHYPEPVTGPQRWEAIAALLQALPPDLQRKMGTENANRLLSREPR